MATWKDGAAYAPIERPDGFATPETEPLEAAAPPSPITPGPMRAPGGFQEAPGSTALHTVGGTTMASRNPSEPFNVSAALMTGGVPAWKTRDPLQPFPTSSQTSTPTLPPPTGEPHIIADAPASSQQWDPPTMPTGPWAPPASPHAPHSSQPNAYQGYLAQPIQRSPQPKPTGMQVLALVILAFGVLIPSATGFLLGVAGFLFYRTPHQRTLGTTALFVGVTLIFTQLILTSDFLWLGPVASLVFGVWALVTLKPPRR